MNRKICRTINGAGLVLALALPMRAQAPSSSREEEAIRKLIATFAEARNSHDGAAVAKLYGEDGEWISEGGRRRVRGLAGLTKLWTDARGQVRRAVEAIEVPGDSVAVVRVQTDYGQPVGVHHEVFFLVKEEGNWRIRVHHTSD